MIGIGMPISQRRSPRPIASSNNAVLRVGRQTPEPSNGSDRFELMFQKQSRTRRVEYQSMRRRMRMRKLAIGIIAAGTLIAAAPAMAQVYLEGPGVGVRVGPEPHYRDYD